MAFSGSGYDKYILRFDISEPGVNAILKSDRFTEIEYVKYSAEYNSLSFGLTSDITTSFSLFDGWRSTYPPGWFRFTERNTFKAYLLKEDAIELWRVRLLLHNPDTGCAYFIYHEVRGT